MPELRLAGVTDIVEDGVNGSLVPPRDAGALAAAIVALLDDPLSDQSMEQRDGVRPSISTTTT